jgi:Mn2+/Fe2+ NRAMP family transporter
MDTQQLLNLILEILKIIILLGIFIVLLLKKKSQRTGEEFAITFNSLSSVLTSYKQHVLDPKLEFMRKQHDLDPKSQSNSIKVFRSISIGRRLITWRSFTLVKG